jgi:hypothetical protein
VTILSILDDYGPDRVVHPEDQIFSWLSNGDPEDDRRRMDEYRRSPGALKFQIKADRYHAFHLLGKLRNRATVDKLISMLSEDEVAYNLPWSLAQIRDDRAIVPLMNLLDNRDAVLRVGAIDALSTLGATAAIPRLQALFSDSEIPRAGTQVSVGSVARKAVHSIEATRP